MYSQQINRKMEERMRDETRAICIRKEFDDITDSVSKRLEEFNSYKIQYTHYRYLHSRYKHEFSIPADLLTHGLNILTNLLCDMDRLIELSDVVEFAPGELEEFKENMANTIIIIKNEERQIKADMEEKKNDE